MSFKSCYTISSMSRSISKFFYITASIIALSAYSFIAFAAGPFLPGATLDPVADFPSDCSGPTDGDCYVQTSEIERGSGAPGSTPSGLDPILYVNEDNGDAYTWDGAAWNPIGGGGAGFDLIVENSVAGFTSPSATGDNAIAVGDSAEATGNYTFAAGILARANGNESIALGSEARAVGSRSLAFGRQAQAEGANSVAIGLGARAYGDQEIALGGYATSYTPVGNADAADRLFVVGNGISAGASGHNAFTMFQSGSFVFNDDNYSYDQIIPGTEEDKFYFDYTKHAIRMGSITNDNWDDAHVGFRSIALGFADPFSSAPIASGTHSVAIGQAGTTASGFSSIAIGNSLTSSGTVSVAFGNSNTASGDTSTAFGVSSTASGVTATAFGSSTASGFLSTSFGGGGIASGDYSTAFGVASESPSFGETAIGFYSTTYIPASSTALDPDDRLFVIGNGDNDGGNSTAMGTWPDRNDAFTILKNGKVGIGINNFEDGANQIDDGAALLQVDGDIYSTGVQTGSLTIMSDRRLKTNIEDLNYGLDAVNALRPVAYDLRSDGSHQYGFIAQEVQGELPILVNDGKYLSLNYIGMIPVLTKAVQELDVKIKAVESQAATVAPSGFSLESIRSWFADAANGIGDFFAHRVHTDELCVGNTCLNETQVQQILETVGATSSADSDGTISSGESTGDGAVISESGVVPPTDEAPESSPDAPPASTEPDPATA